MFQPINIAIDRYGRFFVTDYGENKVKLFDPDNLVTPINSISGFNFNEKNNGFPDLIIKEGTETAVEEEVLIELDGTNTETDFEAEVNNDSIDDDSNILITDGTEIFRIGSNVLESDGGGSGTINHGNGALELVFGVAPAEGTALHADYEYYTIVDNEAFDISANSILKEFTDESLANDNIEILSFSGSITVLPEIADEDLGIDGDDSTVDFSGDTIVLANTPVNIGSLVMDIDVIVPVTGEAVGTGDGETAEFTLDNPAIETEIYKIYVDGAEQTEGNTLTPVTGEAVGIGDGETVVFTLTNSPIASTEGYTVYVDGVEQTEGEVEDYTIDAVTGEITFNAAPASEAPVTADYKYYVEDFTIAPVTGTVTFNEGHEPADTLAVTADYSYVGVCDITDADDGDGTGTLSDSNGYLSTGDIEYATGAITNLVFNNAPITGDLLASYKFEDTCNIEEDGVGGLSADDYLVSGSINYDNGTVSLVFDSAPKSGETMEVDYIHKTAVTDEAVTPDPVFDGEETEVTGTLTNTPIVPGTLSLNLEDDSEIFTLVEDFETLAPLAGTAGGTGTFNFLNGEITLSFAVAPTSNVVIDYTYTAGDKLFVSDPFNHVVKVFNANTLTLLATLGEFGDGDEELHLPAGIALNEDESELHVVDSNNNRISVWNSSTYAHVENYGELNHGDDSGLYFPVDIKHIGLGVMYVVDSGHNRIVSFDNDGSESDPYVIKELDTYVGHSYDESGVLSLTTTVFPAISLETDGTNFYLSDLYTSNIAKFDASWVEDDAVAEYGTDAGEVKFSKGMLISGNNMYVADTGSNEIEVISLA